VHPLEQ